MEDIGAAVVLGKLGFQKESISLRLGFREDLTSAAI